MCGIFGFYCYGNARPSQKIVEAGWVANEQRGGDASGAAYLVGDERQSFFLKADATVSKFLPTIQADTWKDILKSPMGMFHTRKWTKGSPKNNKNNHPLPYHGWMMVHNGSISNDDALMDHLYPKARYAEVDSEAINGVLGHGSTLDESLSNLSTLSGTAAFAAWKINDPVNMLLGRVGSGVPAQLFIGLDERHRIAYFSSEVDGLNHISGREILGFVIPQGTQLAYDRVVVLSPKSNEFYKIANTPFYQPSKVVPFTPFNRRGVDVSEGARADWSNSFSGTGTGQQKAIRGRISSLAVLGDADIRKVKYAPHLDNVEAQWFMDAPTLKEGDTKQQFATPYGQWCVSSKEGRLFRPHKRVRKWWEAQLGTPPRDLCKDGDVFLPVIDDAVRTLLANEFDLELVNLTETGFATQYGLMCPWCGVFAPYYRWNQWKDICGWCRLKSNRPEGVQR